MTDHEEKTFAIQIASTERAMLECLYLAPRAIDLMECLQVMEVLANLRPQVVQELLVACRSIKVKRVFLYLAERAGHQWLRFVDTSEVDLGKGVSEVDQKAGSTLPNTSSWFPGSEEEAAAIRSAAG